PANIDIPVPAVCGTHHNLRNAACRLVIIFRPMKSITSGLTCVAAYNAPECENGLRNGLASVPYPPEIARRVDHASKAAAPEDANVSAYQTFFCRSLSYSRLKAGLPGLMARGELPGTIGSAAGAGITGAELEASAISTSLLIFGSGTDGRTLAGVESLVASMETPAGRSTTVFATSPLCGKGLSKRIVASSIFHLSS